MEEDSSDLREALASMLDAQKLCSSSIVRETGSREPQLGLGFIICMIWTPPCADLESPRTGQCAVGWREVWRQSLQEAEVDISLALESQKWCCSQMEADES